MHIFMCVYTHTHTQIYICLLLVHDTTQRLKKGRILQIWTLKLGTLDRHRKFLRSSPIGILEQITVLLGTALLLAGCFSACLVSLSTALPQPWLLKMSPHIAKCALGVRSPLVENHWDISIWLKIENALSMSFGKYYWLIPIVPFIITQLLG